MRHALAVPAAGFIKVTSVTTVSAARQRRVTGGRGAACLVFCTRGMLSVSARGRGAAWTSSLFGGQAILLSSSQGLSIRLAPAAGTDCTILRFRGCAAAEADSRCRDIEIPEGAVLHGTRKLRHLLLLLGDAARSSTRSSARLVWPRMALSHLTALILLELSRGAAVEENGQGSPADLVDAFINARRCQPVSTREIAAALGYNPDYLERAYRARRGRSIRAAVRARRIREACVLLGGAAPGSQAPASPAPRVAEVARLCGYADAGPFRRAFKRAAGIAPREYRTSTGGPG